MPDAFSRQVGHTRKNGGSDIKTGGTLKFVLDDSTEVYVHTYDYAYISLALWIPKTGDNELLYK